MAQKTIRDALADDFDTRTMMTAVMGLVHVSNIELSKTNPKVRNKTNPCAHSYHRNNKYQLTYRK